jgi:hypothetical protein
MVVDLNRKEKSVVDEDGYEWVEKTHESLGMSMVPLTQTNGHCWDEAVSKHLNHLSHRGYGSANGKSAVHICELMCCFWLSGILQQSHSQFFLF